MPNVRRGEVWQVDFGLAAKVRPALVLGCDIADEDRVLVAVVYHTTALRGSRYEVPMRVPGLDEAASTHKASTPFLPSNSSGGARC
jgi:mRNA interferase MazF